MEVSDVPKLTIADFPFIEKVKTCSPETPIRKACTLLKENNIGALVITGEDDEVLGIFTERDLLNKFAFEEGREPQDPISQYMTENPYTTTIQTKLERAFGLMRLKKFRHLIIVDEELKCKGILSMKDCYNFFCDHYFSSKGRTV